MNFASMDYFIMVAREKSFTKAAQRLYITQQTLSAHIASIEKELGCSLFVRHVPLELTYAGQVFLKYALDFQKRHRSMEQEFNDIAHRQQGRLRIGIAYTRGHALMPQLITEFQDQYPRMQVHLLEASNNTLHKMLLDGELDLAIAYFPEHISGLELEDFYREEIVLLAARSLLDEIYGDKADEVIRQVRESGDVSLLGECPFLLNGLNDVAGQLSRRLFDAVGLNPNVRAQSKNIETLLGLCGYRLADVGALTELPARLEAYGPARAAEACGIGLPTMRDIVRELCKPGRDPRDELPQPALRTDILELKDLKPGMVLTGTVRNVIDFGVFVDIGVHQDGLVHISQVCNKFIKHPSEAVSVGDIVRVAVLEVDEKRKRISLTLRGVPKDGEPGPDCQKATR